MAGNVFAAPNGLKSKVGGRFAFDADALAKAEAALKSLSGQFAQWMDDELAKLDAAHARLQQEGKSPSTLDALYLRAHDLKGLGATYEFPIVSRIATSLCKLIETPKDREGAPLALIDAHVSAIKAAVRGGIKTAEHPVGQALVQELESRTRGFGEPG